MKLTQRYLLNITPSISIYGPTDKFSIIYHVAIIACSQNKNRTSCHVYYVYRCKKIPKVNEVYSLKSSMVENPFLEVVIF